MSYKPIEKIRGKMMKRFLAITLITLSLPHYVIAAEDPFNGQSPSTNIHKMTTLEMERAIKEGTEQLRILTAKKQQILDAARALPPELISDFLKPVDDMMAIHQEKFNQLLALQSQLSSLNIQIEEESFEALQDVSQRISSHIFPLLQQASEKGLTQPIIPETAEKIQQSTLDLLPALYSCLMTNNPDPFMEKAKVFFDYFIKLATDALKIEFVDDKTRKEKIDFIEKKLKQKLGIK